MSAASCIMPAVDGDSLVSSIAISDVAGNVPVRSETTLALMRNSNDQARFEEDPQAFDHWDEPYHNFIRAIKGEGELKYHEEKGKLPPSKKTATVCHCSIREHVHKLGDTS